MVLVSKSNARVGNSKEIRHCRFLVRCLVLVVMNNWAPRVSIAWSSFVNANSEHGTNPIYSDWTLFIYIY
ncbi:unnamed protein product [Absidia cylindrospora]